MSGEGRETARHDAVDLQGQDCRQGPQLIGSVTVCECGGAVPKGRPPCASGNDKLGLWSYGWGRNLSNYLEIAETVLKQTRRPLTPRGLMEIAYRNGIVAPHLHGRTQNKTMGARLSEDIVRRGERSLFFRTGPGRFFLREFITDVSIPEQFRQPVPTKRRFRELVRANALSVKKSALDSSYQNRLEFSCREIMDILNDENTVYSDPRTPNKELAYVHSFVCVRRESAYLSYRVGRYRENRDAFLQKKSIGFTSYVHEFDNNLFSQSDLGIVEAGVNAVVTDLDLPYSNGKEQVWKSFISHFLCFETPYRTDLLAVINFTCPSWFEPTKRRLALNDVRWIVDAGAVNDVDDFDPWSRAVLASGNYGMYEQ